ncbi:hypothetical protein [Nocardioides perillae]|uniref:Uncharacterized protein n=1 Tax=Nocardioides perillae TaxID=1119534 RepID=A0A7Y9RR59_9ACTN|nr:hypothetical protein [Nocardioides perillae]NYG55056.1 hypothetical protein [Nocardioides perillae]
MYQDHQPCRVCGAEVQPRPRREPTRTEADDTVDERHCTNPDCATHGDGPDAPTP